jgi:cell division protease FtsH
MKKKPNGYKMIIIALVILSIVFSAIYNFNKSEIEVLKYTEFMKLVEENKIEMVDLRKDSDNILVRKTNGEEFKTDNPNKDEFKENLLNKGIKVENNTPLENKVTSVISSFASFGFTLVLILLIYKTMKPALKEKDSLVKESSKVNFKNVAGNLEAKEDMEFLVDFLKSPNKYKDIGAKLPKGIVLYGPPGTGKTLMAKAVAGEAGVPFYNISGSDFVEMYAGLGAKRVRDLFKKAKKTAPCIIFIDEIDAIGTHRGGVQGHAEKDQTINALLSELDGFDKNDSVIVMAATNRVEDLDSALIRPGRFDRHVSIGLPDYKDRKSILEIYAKNKKLDKSVDLESLANITIGFSGASLEALMNEAAIIAITKGSSVIREQDIDDSYFKITMKGNKKNNRDINKKDIKLVAFHEAGHALVTKLLTDKHLHKVTIIPSTSGAGGATFAAPKKLGLISKQEILNNIKVLYAGRAGEELLTGNIDDVTSGASSDIKQATKYINSYFSELGMSEKFGMLELKDDKLYMKDAIKLSNQLYEETLKLLKKNRDKLENIADALIEKETLSGKDVDKILEM